MYNIIIRCPVPHLTLHILYCLLTMSRTTGNSFPFLYFTYIHRFVALWILLWEMIMSFIFPSLGIWPVRMLVFRKVDIRCLLSAHHMAYGTTDATSRRHYHSTSWQLEVCHLLIIALVTASISITSKDELYWQRIPHEVKLQFDLRQLHLCPR